VHETALNNEDDVIAVRAVLFFFQRIATHTYQNNNHEKMSLK
jgi:hypothetical protein